MLEGEEEAQWRKSRNETMIDDVIWAWLVLEVERVGKVGTDLHLVFPSCRLLVVVQEVQTGETIGSYCLVWTVWLISRTPADAVWYVCTVSWRWLSEGNMYIDHVVLYWSAKAELGGICYSTSIIYRYRKRETKR